MTVVQKAIKNRLKNCKLVMFSPNSYRFLKNESRNWRVGVFYLLYQLEKFSSLFRLKSPTKIMPRTFLTALKLVPPVDSPDQVLEWQYVGFSLC